MDCYTTALTLLSRRELSTAQLRTRLMRRTFDSSEIDDVIERLAQERTLDDRRVAIAAARLEGAIRRRGRRRVLQRVQQLGIDATLAEAAVNEVFLEIDEGAMLEQAIDRKLGATNPPELDRKIAARLVRSLVAQGFELRDVCLRLRAKGVRGI